MIEFEAKNKKVNVIINGKIVGEAWQNDGGTRYSAQISTGHYLHSSIYGHGDTREAAVHDTIRNGRLAIEKISEAIAMVERATMTREDEIKEATIRS